MQHNQLPQVNTMYDKMNEQLQKQLKPVTEITELNAKALEQLAVQQNDLFKSLLTSTVQLAEGASKKSDINALAEAQKEYAQDVQETLVKAAKESYSIISSAQEKSGEIIKSALSDAQSQMVNAAKI